MMRCTNFIISKKLNNLEWAALATLPFSCAVSAADLIHTSSDLSFRDFMEKISRLGQFSDPNPLSGLSGLEAKIF